jgi:ABC-2 type transport system permease protein
LRSRELAVLVRKELAELFAGRAFWLLLLLIGLLTGQSFISAVNAYAEASGIGGGPSALAQGLSPLDGIVSPTFGAYDLALMLLFPFVAIRLIAIEKSSDALKLMLQFPASLSRQLSAKVIALFVAWLIALMPLAIALGLWLSYGGHLDATETVNLAAGYTLRFLLTAGIAAAAAAMMPGAANAAIAVLGFTIGTWALDFLAAGRGGLVQTIASFTPAATLRNFEHGLFRLDVALVMLIVAALGFALAAIWLDLGRGIRARTLRSIAASVIALIAAIGASAIPVSADFSENRRNSFPPAEQRMLARINEPLTITIFLAAEDPRMNDFDRNVLIKLRRAVPRLRVAYPYAGRSGLFESDQRYGEVVYRLGAKTAVSRSTTEEIVVETIATLAGLPAPSASESTYPGYPLAKQPGGAALIFYLFWPIAIVTSRLLLRNRRTG